MIEKEGACPEAGRVSRSKSPKKWRIGAHYAHFQLQLRTGLPLCCCLVFQTHWSHTTRVCTVPRHQPHLAAWLWKFHGLRTWKTYSGAVLEPVASVVTVDYWHTAGFWQLFIGGKSVLGRLHSDICHSNRTCFVTVLSLQILRLNARLSSKPAAAPTCHLCINSINLSMSVINASR